MTTPQTSSKNSSSASSPVADLGPIRNIWAVGRNYADHAKELGHAVPSSQGDPMIFLKAGSSVVAHGESFRLPSFSNDVHHEVEVAFRFGANLEFDAVTIALDLTARDLQAKLKANAHPWTLAKSFQASCPLGPLVALPPGLDPAALEFSLEVDGELRQRGSTRNMIHPIAKLRTYVLERFPVVPGDLLLTGTPVGVAQLRSGQKLLARIDGLVQAIWTVA